MQHCVAFSPSIIRLMSVGDARAVLPYRNVRFCKDLSRYCETPVLVLQADGCSSLEAVLSLLRGSFRGPFPTLTGHPGPYGPCAQLWSVRRRKCRRRFCSARNPIDTAQRPRPHHCPCTPPGEPATWLPRQTAMRVPGIKRQSRSSRGKAAAVELLFASLTCSATARTGANSSTHARRRPRGASGA
jgi:hypothetical protein